MRKVFLNLRNVRAEERLGSRVGDDISYARLSHGSTSLMKLLARYITPPRAEAPLKSLVDSGNPIMHDSTRLVAIALSYFRAPHHGNAGKINPLMRPKYLF